MTAKLHALNSAAILPETGPDLDGWPASPKNIYTFDPKISSWIPRTPDTHPPTSPVLITSFALITWNVDFMAAHEKSRLKGALNHLQTLIDSLAARSPPVPCIVLIQEMHDNCFGTLLQHPLVMDCYDVTDISSYSWENYHFSYGTVTLVPRLWAANVVSVFRTKFQTSKMGREALYVDLCVPRPPNPNCDHSSTNPEAPQTIRIANVHLESLRGTSDRARIRQLTSVAAFLSAPKIHAGLVGGDMNPIAPSDSCLPTQLSLRDAWNHCHAPRNVPAEIKEEKKVEDNGWIAKGGDDDPDGHTWGYQPTSHFPPRRMDKILLAGGLKAEEIERIGVSLKVVPEQDGDDVDEDDESFEEEEAVWVSDHYGLLAILQMQST